MSIRIITAFELIKKLACKENEKETEDQADKLMLTTVSNIMRTHMEVARNEGKGGWWDDSDCTEEYLTKLLKKCIDNKDWIDAANYAGMLFMRKHMETTNPE